MLERGIGSYRATAAVLERSSLVVALEFEMLRCQIEGVKAMLNAL